MTLSRWCDYMLENEVGRMDPGSLRNLTKDEVGVLESEISRKSQTLWTMAFHEINRQVSLQVTGIGKAFFILFKFFSLPSLPFEIMYLNRNLSFYVPSLSQCAERGELLERIFSEYFASTHKLMSLAEDEKERALAQLREKHKREMAKVTSSLEKSMSETKENANSNISTLEKVLGFGQWNLSLFLNAIDLKSTFVGSASNFHMCLLLMRQCPSP